MEKKGLKILLVDDDESARGVYAEVFRQEGYSVEEAQDGLDGLDKATKNPPQLIFTGIIMPRMDGFALIDALRKNVATANIPIIMVSHMGREEDRRKSEEMGVRDFIVQGMITPRQVLEKISHMFGGPKEYKLVFDPEAADASQLAEDFHLPKGFECHGCHKKFMLKIKVSDIVKKEFVAKFYCPDCEDKVRLA